MRWGVLVEACGIFVLFEMGGLGEMGDLCDFVGLMYESYRSVVCGL